MQDKGHTILQQFQKNVLSSPALKSSGDGPVIAIGDIQFYDNYLPPLKDGTFVITATPTLPAALNAPASDVQDITQAFAIKGPRFALPIEEIHGVSPIALSSGEYDTHLPHVIITKRALPWERMMGTSNSIPWVALLVFSEDELIPFATGASTTGAVNVTVADLLSVQTGIAKPKLLQVTDEESTILCASVTLNSDLFVEIAPLMNELPSLSHCRQVNTGDKEILGIKDDGWFSVVVANRFPKALKGAGGTPVKNIAHLVSLEGCETYLSGQPLQEQKIQLISLYSWSFVCLPEKGESFGELMNAMMTNAKASDHIPVLRLSPQLNTGEIDPAIVQRLANGFTILPAKARSGEQTVSWYRGPLLPVEQTELFPDIKDSITGEAFLVYDKANGMFDSSYTCAWQIGRALAAGDQHFAQGLIRFRREIQLLMESILHKDQLQEVGVKLHATSPVAAWASYLKAGLIGQINTIVNREAPYTVERTSNQVARLPGKLSPKEKSQALKDILLSYATSGLGLTLPDPLKEFLLQMRYLVQMPFNYLVPNELMLPVESIRFFHTDPVWLDAMTKGALSVGIHSSHDELLNDLVLENLKVNGYGKSDAVCGLLLRSAVVSGWPGLAVRVDTDYPNSTVKVLRQERIAENLLICLFDGIPVQVSICEPQEQLAFGVSGDTLDEGFIEIRKLNGEVGFPTGQQMLVTDPKFPLLRDQKNRVLDFEKLQSGLLNSGLTPSNGGTIFGPGDLAVEFVRAPEDVNFNPAAIANYTLTTEPEVPVTGKAAAINIKITPPATASFFQSIAVDIPIGDTCGSWAHDLTGASFTITGTTWKMGTVPDEAGIIMIQPLSGNPEIIPAGGISAQLSFPAISTLAGTCDISVQEMHSPSATGEMSIGNIDFWIDKKNAS